MISWSAKNRMFSDRIEIMPVPKKLAEFASYGFWKFCSRTLVVAPRGREWLPHLAMTIGLEKRQATQWCGFIGLCCTALLTAGLG
jgi:hypothetical protein